MLYKEIQLKNGQACILRQSLEEDAQNVLDYVNIVCGETDFLTFGKSDMPWTLEEEQKFIKEHFESDNKLIIVAEVQGHIVGITGFTGGKTKRVQHVGEFGISVLQQYWGLGIGRALVENLIEWAGKSGVVRKINLRVRVDNKRAIKLYKSLGFSNEGLISRQFLINNKFYDVYCMGFEINP